jgi:transcriptional regulator with XRE-family HTH domain
MPSQVIHNKLRELRTLKHLRQQDVADLIHLDCKDRICHWEEGTSMPSVINLFRLYHVFNAYPHEIYPDLFEDSNENI